ncbi:MAG: LuxR family transcriptional regulator [Pseudomonadota bacterium]
MKRGLHAFDRLDQVARTESLADLSRLLQHEAVAVGFDVLAFGEATDPTRFANTWPEDWLSTYSELGLVEDDPLVVDAVTRAGPFTWREARRRRKVSRREQRVLDLVGEHGWFDGYCVPIHGPNGYFALSVMAGREAAFSAQQRRMLHMTVLQAHERANQILGRPFARPDATLTRRQTDCLAFVADGYSDADIAEILGISETTARFHVDSARRRLGARTRAQAAAQAVWRGLIRL